MEMKNLGFIAFILILLTIIGGYNLYNHNKEDRYYENYRFHSIKMDSANDQSVNALSYIFVNLIGNKSQYNTTKALKIAQDNASSALEFDKEMQKYAASRSQKNYSEILIQQTDLMIKNIDLLFQLDKTSKQGNNKGSDELINQIGKVNNQIDYYETELEQIKNNDSEFKKRIEKEYLATKD